MKTPEDMQAVAIIAAMLVSSAPPESRECFDWAVVGHVKRATYLGLAPSTPEAISMDGLWDWDFAVRDVVIGAGLPHRLNLMVASHTEGRWGKERRIAVFLAGGHGAGPLVVERRAVDPRSRTTLRRQIEQIAAEAGLERCYAAGGPPPNNDRYGSMTYGAFLGRLDDLQRINNDLAKREDERKRAQAELTEMWDYLKARSSAVDDAKQ
jgi:hypothetical protein